MVIVINILIVVILLYLPREALSSTQVLSIDPAMQREYTDGAWEAWRGSTHGGSGFNLGFRVHYCYYSYYSCYYRCYY